MSFLDHGNNVIGNRSNNPRGVISKFQAVRDDRERLDVFDKFVHSETETICQGLSNWGHLSRTLPPDLPEAHSFSLSLSASLTLSLSLYLTKFVEVCSIFPVLAMKINRAKVVFRMTGKVLRVWWDRENKLGFERHGDSTHYSIFSFDDKRDHNSPSLYLDSPSISLAFSLTTYSLAQASGTSKYWL